MEKYWVQEDVQIAMASYHTLKDCPQNYLPLGPRTRTSPVPLFSESRQIWIGSALEKGDRDKMRRLPEGLAMTILKVIILNEQSLEQPITLEGYRINPPFVNLPRPAIVQLTNLSERDQLCRKQEDDAIYQTPEI